MPITFTAITFTTPDEFVEVASRLEDFSIRDLIQALDNKPLGTHSAANPSSSKNVSPSAQKNPSTRKPSTNRKGRRHKEGTLVDQIKHVIGEFIQRNEEFTANSIYEALDTGKTYINKKSVVSSVQKLMREGDFAKIPREDRRDGAPRAKKVYIPA